ncbi:hypothetical protein [Clostridium sp. ZS2-4]|uniref:hypothetical protein n=1 Tax=Clostridium sp. ZS2-4 TaxID=2987703 RepID=UPI00227BA821|nr:hypothetical protein [Clostridium sp. ZS2-4]MCY6355348.1 hypothetical protein [Clostridium sp. ZS2-4]
MKKKSLLALIFIIISVILLIICINKKNNTYDLPPEYSHNLFLLTSRYEEMYEKLKDKPLDINNVLYLKKELSTIKQYSSKINEFITDDSLEITTYLFLKNINYLENNYKKHNKFNQESIEIYRFTLDKTNQLINIIYEEYYDKEFHYGGNGIEPKTLDKQNELIKSLIRTNIQFNII